MKVKKSPNFIRVVKSTVIAINIEANILFDFIRSSAPIVELIDDLYTKRGAFLARGLAEVRSEVPFFVRVINLSDTR